MIEGTHRSLVHCLLTVNSAKQAKIATAVERLAVIMMKIIKNSIQKGVEMIHINTWVSTIHLRV